ncbi:MAG: hypothetical protein JRI95_06610 [Deltaproteobacteria bacterium]|nr:hypothetical protein [Deltaproteobacteria bacterium]MBW2085302.1 hypothetical protein [Deltaproteobacteria bacterium]
MSLLKIVLLAMLLGSFLGAGPAWALTPEQTRQLTGLGLSQRTIDLLSSLEQDPGRTRKPSLTFEQVKKLAEEGLAEDIIQLLIRLDRASGAKSRLTVTPAAVSELKKAGVSNETLCLMLESEIRIAGRAATDMGTWTITRPDGTRVIVYAVGDPTRPLPSLSQRQEQELRRALRILKHLNITIEIPYRRSD